jgi:hypothetical protein
MIIFVSASESELAEEQMEIARRLERLHGDIHVTREASGIHLNMASPVALQLDGDQELQKRHLAVNITKALQRIPNCAYCMKYRKPYTLNELFNFKPLVERGVAASVTLGVSSVSGNEDRMEEIEPGVFVPHKPGAEIALDRLPETHVVHQYLRQRQFDPVQLQAQFGCTFCTRHNPVLYWKRGPGDLDNTSQARLIFYIYGETGQYEGWQGRVLDRMQGNTYEVYHPYLNRFEAVYTREGDIKIFKQRYDGADIHKYLTAVGTRRNQVLIGLHAAVKARLPYLILTEGPLDAGRLGPPACAALGKFVSRHQLKRCAGIAGTLYYVSQNDAAGEEARAKLAKVSAEMGIPVTRLVPPDEFNDVGEMSPEQAWDWFKDQTNIELPTLIAT